jgi:hypothetical protein
MIVMVVRKTSLHYTPSRISFGCPKHTDDNAGDRESSIKGQDDVSSDKQEHNPDNWEANHEALEEIAHQCILHPHPAQSALSEFRVVLNKKKWGLSKSLYNKFTGSLLL